VGSIHPTSNQPAGAQGKPAPDRCPWCGQAVTHELFERITAQIAAKERERAAQVERGLREKLATERAAIEAGAKALVAKTQKDAEVALAKMSKEAAEREAHVRAEATKSSEAAAAARIAAAENARKAALEQLASTKAGAEAMVADRLRAQRETLDRARVEAVNGEKAKAFADRQKLDEKLAALQRQLQAKTADELGEGAEIDLFEALRAEFRDDRFARVKKGTAGADIIHEIVHNGRVAGVIVYDSKNRDAWRNDYATKLRNDQLAAKADHAILASRVFPSRAHQIHLQDGVIVANPARVIDLVQLLRRHVLSIEGLRLAGQKRAEKAQQLYEFITSDRCVQMFEEIDTLTDDLLALDVKEVKAHESTWRHRGQLLKSVQRVRGSLVNEIEQVVGTAVVEATA
jgi:hypothetical protein